MPRIVPGADTDMARRLAGRLREADKLEIFRATRHTPLKGLELSLKGTLNAFHIEHRGRVEGIGGCTPIPGNPRVGSPWGMGSDFITEHPVWFLRATPEIWATVSKDYDYLWNLVDARNTVHVRWLEWSGCTFIGHRELNGNPFLEFVKNCVNP